MESLGNYNFAEKSKEKLLNLENFNGDDAEDDDELGGHKYLCYTSMINFWKYLVDFGGKAWEMGRSDPRKFIFGVKMGLALAVVSLLMFWKESYHDIDQYSIWAILTVIVMFEFSIGATFIKGFNRGLGTLFAGILACCFSQLAFLAGHQWEGAVIISSIFIIVLFFLMGIGFLASYLKLYPTMKPYEYGFRVFILTYCILMAAGHRTGKYTEAVVTRLVLIGVGAAVCLVINICICPIWSGEDLHDLVIENFKGVANSLEDCVNGYLNCEEYKKITPKILTYEAAEDPLFKGYRAVVESKTQEQNLLDFAIWEPPHGPYRMCNYPWRSYVKVGGALRHCAFLAMALHGCILSEIQAPAERRQVFQDELQRVGAEGAKVLRQLGNKVEKMEKLGHGDILKEVHEAAEQLQKKIDQRSYLLVNSESWEICTRHMQHEEPENLLDSNENENVQLGHKSLSETVVGMRSTPSSAKSDQSAEYLFTKHASWPFRVSFDGDGVVNEDKFKTYESASALSLATFASLLIEFVARLQNVVDSFEELCEKAEFREPILNTLPTKTRSGFWPRLICCFRFKR